MARTTSQFRMFGLPTDGTKKGNAYRREVLNLNKEIRNSIEPLGHLPWGSSMLQIPELDYYVLIRRFPELNSPDAEIKTKSWDKFARSTASEPYRVRSNRNQF